MLPYTQTLQLFTINLKRGGVYHIYKGIKTPSWKAWVERMVYERKKGWSHRHPRNMDCLMALTAWLVCFISTVNSRSKKRKKRSLL
jgi:hypothetical protein